MPKYISNNSTRNMMVDCLRGIGIILMVALHGGLKYKNFVYLFHMPLFFILSGMCYKYGKTEFDTFVFKKIKSLYFPYLIVNLFGNVLDDIGYIIKNGFSAVNWLVVFEQIRNTIIFSGDVTLLTIPTWFFKTLFWVIILYDLLNRFLHSFIKEHAKRKNIRLAVLVALLVFGWLEKLCLDDYWGNIFCSMILVEIGSYITNLLQTYSKLSQRNHWAWPLTFILSFLVLQKMSKWEIELSQNEIVNPVFFVCSSCIGFILLYSTYQMIIVRSKRMQAILSYIGKNSIWIVALHLFAFRVVALIQVKYYGLPLAEIGQLFRPITEPYWWIAYTVVGVTVPLLVKQCFSSLIKLKETKYG